ncbi:MAG: hypothetical protein JSS14_22845 [Proteobacteria bacterium]|nr:hypothetical protein [Pseudomonadota bacterium]
MPHRFHQRHWMTFSGIPFVPQGPFGQRPANWAAAHGIPAQPGHPLPTKVLTRQQVRIECQDPSKPVLHGYICAMAWGLQGAGPTQAHVATAWADRAAIEHRLLQLRAGGLTREQAYDLFANNPIPGLGPSYFTKLVYFFRPDDTVGYIMDQWTGKSINLITGHHVVRIYSDSPSALNTWENYESFCRVIDFVATQQGCTGDQVEQRLFSQNGQHRRPRGAWRNHVRSNWAIGKPVHGYDHAAMKAWVRAL